MSGPLRVLHLIDSLGPGGAERSLVELAGELRRRGHEPVVARLRDAAESLEPDLAAAGVPVVRVEAARLPGQIRAVRRLLAEHKPHVLHTTLFDSDVAGRLAAIGTEVGVLTSLVNTSYEPARLLDPRVRRSRLRTAQVLDAATARLRGDRFHAISRAVADSAIHRLHLRSDSVTVVPRGRRRDRLGEPSSERRRRVRTQLGLAEEQFVVVHVGREDFQKGHVHLIQGFHAARARHPRLALVMAGRRGNASDEVVRELTHGDRGILRLGFRSDVGDLLAAGDVFAFPSIYEGLGGAVIEAMAMALPVIASDIPALREVLGSPAMLVAPGDALGLAAALEAVSSDAERLRLDGQRNRERFDTHFEFATVMDQMVEVIMAAARHRKRA